MKASYHSDIDKAILDSFVGIISEEDQIKLDKWRQESARNEQAYAHLKKVWDADFTEPKYINYQSLEESIISKGFPQNDSMISKIKKFSPFLKIAATIVLLITVSFLIYKSIDYTDQPTVEQQEITPAEITKYNPPGQKSRIILPDNSVVWLNSDSKLTYIKGFAGDTRILSLQGEAFFEVEKDPNKPFVVQSGMVKTTAIGTSFNIRNFSDEESIKVSLLSGEVKVNTENSNSEDYIVKLKEELSFTKNADLLGKAVLNDNLVSSWKDGIIYFERSDMDFVISTLERTYAVNFDLAKYNSKKWSYTGQFDKLSLETVLKRIGYSEGFEFAIEGKNIVLTNKL